MKKFPSNMTEPELLKLAKNKEELLKYSVDELLDMCVTIANGIVIDLDAALIPEHSKKQGVYLPSGSRIYH